MKKKIVKILVKILVGQPKFRCHADKIETVCNAVKWAVAALPGLEADCNEHGQVTVFIQ